MSQFVPFYLAQKRWYEETKTRVVQVAPHTGNTWYWGLTYGTRYNELADIASSSLAEVVTHTLCPDPVIDARYFRSRYKANVEPPTRRKNTKNRLRVYSQSGFQEHFGNHPVLHIQAAVTVLEWADGISTPDYPFVWRVQLEELTVRVPDCNFGDAPPLDALTRVLAERYQVPVLGEVYHYQPSSPYPAALLVFTHAGIITQPQPE